MARDAGWRISLIVGVSLISASYALECEVTDWSVWSHCSELCEGGLQTRSRLLESPSNAATDDNSTNATAIPTCDEPELAQTRSCNTQHCAQSKLHFSEVKAWPMGRESIQNIIDGDEDTWSYSTKGWCQHESIYIGLKLQAPTKVSGLRLHKKYHKSHNSGHNKKDCNRKNIQLLYSTETDESRTLDRHNWQQVREASNGHGSREMWTTHLIRPDGYIVGDEHDSAQEGWASVSFAPVEATAVALEISHNGGEYNHFCVNEIEAFYAPPQASEEL